MDLKIWGSQNIGLILVHLFETAVSIRNAYAKIPAHIFDNPNTFWLKSVIKLEVVLLDHDTVVLFIGSDGAKPGPSFNLWKCPQIITNVMYESIDLGYFLLLMVLHIVAKIALDRTNGL